LNTPHDPSPYPAGSPAPGSAAPYVERSACDAFRTDQREAHARTWQELRSLRRLVIALVVGGQLFAGGVNVAGFAYWIDRHAAHPHASTVRMLAEVRAETRADLRDLRREVRDLALLALREPREPRDLPESSESSKGDPPCPAL